MKPGSRSILVTAKDYRTFIKDIGWGRFLLLQAVGGFTGVFTLLSLSSLFGVLALLFSNTPGEVLAKLDRLPMGFRLPDFVTHHLLGAALMVSLLFLVLKLAASVTYSYLSTLFLENYAMRIRLAILDKYYDSYGLLDSEVKDTEILYFNHQLLRYVSYFVALIKANLEAFNSVFLFVFLMAISVKLSLVSAACLGFLFLLTRPIHNFSKRMGKEYNGFVFLVERSINRITRGVEVLKTNNGKGREFSALGQHNRGMVRKSIGMDVSEKVILIFPELMSLALIACLLAFVSGFDKSIIIAFLYSLLKLFTSLNQVNFLLNNALKLSSVPEEIHAYLDSWKAMAGPESARGRDPGKVSSIGLHHLRLARNGNTIYRADQIEFAVGDRIQVFGPNGCGKSSLAKAILGLMPYEGIITVNGCDIREIDKAELFNRVSYLPQRFYLFNESVLENLQLGNGASREEIEGLVSDLGIEPFIRGLPRGLDTIIHEDMKNLSGGQIQALSIARALLKKADVYILDEYGNNLDPVVKEKVDTYLRERLGQAILIVITHLPLGFTTRRLDFAGLPDHVEAV